MGYFAAQLRPRPLAAPQGVTLWQEPSGWRVTWGAPPPGVTAARLVRGDAPPYKPVTDAPAHRRWWLLPEEGGVTIGVAWLRGTETGAATFVQLPHPTPALAEHACPLCRQPLQWQARLWQCNAGCGARWVSQFGQLVDVATLPYGVCTCCAQAQPLLQSGELLLCAVTRQPYAPPLTESGILGAIDKALHENQAKVGLFGLFEP